MCIINPNTQCGQREREKLDDGTYNFFRTGYQCELPIGHEGPHKSCEGAWLPEHSEQPREGPGGVL